jgi:two-component system chemotaxis sensor kinase CheA
MQGENMPDRSGRYVDLYLSEVREHINSLNELFLHLEKHPDDRASVLEAFREMHSIKGDSAMMELHGVVEVAHEAENLLAAIKDGRLAVSSAVIDQLLGYVDRIEGMVEAFARGDSLGGAKPAGASSVPPGAPGRPLDQTLGPEGAGLGPGIGDDAVWGTGGGAEGEIKACAGPGAKAGAGRDAGADFNIDAGVNAGAGADGKADLNNNINRNSNANADAVARPPSNSGTFKLVIRNNFEEKLKPIRVFALLRALAENGDLVAVVPPYERLAAGDVPPEVVATISTQDLQKLKEDVLKIEGVVSVSVSDLAEGEVKSGAEGAAPKEEGVGSLKAMDKIHQIDRLISNVETKSQETASASVDVTKDKHKLGEIKVNVQSLDRLFNLAGELVLAKSRLNNIVKSLDSADLKEIQRFIDGVVTDLQNEVMTIRLMPVGQVFGVFSRVVRDMAKSSGKEIDLVVEGGDTALDRKVLEEIIDPVVHVIRNAVDHGIEPPEERLKKGKNAVGTIRIKAYRDAANFILDVEDDGRGIDPQAVKEIALSKGLINAKKAESMSDEEALYLICVPGFSTNKGVSITSGRGIGMSAVKSKIDSLGGSLTIKSSLGRGTTISMRLPASVTTMKILVLRVGEQRYAVPLSDVVEIVRVSESIKRYIKGEPFIDLRGRIIRVYALSELLSIKDDSELGTAVIVRKTDGREYGLLVSEVLDEDEVALKPVPNMFYGKASLMGASVLGDGSPTFIIDVMDLV